MACGSVLAYTWNADRTEQLVVQIDKEGLGLAIGASPSVLIESGGTKLGVHVDLYDQPPYSTYCTDVFRRSNRPRRTIWAGLTGKVTIRTFALAHREGHILPSTYGVEIRVEHVTFQGPDGQTVSVKGPVVLRGQGGWLPA